MADIRVVPQLLDPEFWCPQCKTRWRDDCATVTDNPDQPHHPWDYESWCNLCGITVGVSPRQKGLITMWGRATGKKSPEGIKAVTQNLKGHPTPEETKKTRFNALKTGIHANKAATFPARPGRYAACDGCDYFGHREGVCLTHPPNGHENPPACLRKTEILLRNLIAIENGDHAMLLNQHAMQQGNLAILFDEMVSAIAQDGGPRQHVPMFTTDKDGGYRFIKYRNEKGEEEQLHEIKEHPLVRRALDFVTKNHITMSDLVMTPKAAEQEETLKGFIDEQQADRESAEQARLAQQSMLERIAGQIANSEKTLKQDSVLIEYNRDEAEDADDGPHKLG